jgi:plastocyanin
MTASASDNVSTVAVQFLLDGANLGAEVIGPGPTYTYNWRTTAAANGTRTLSARVRDGAGNTAMAPNVSVTVANTAPGGLIGAYLFNEGSGTTASDTSGNNPAGAISGATWTTAGKYDDALTFNGSTNYVDLGNPTALQSTGSMTWTAWVKATSTPADDGQIIAKSDGNSGWQLKTSPDTGPHTFAISVSSGGGSSGQRYSATVRQLNVWYHVAGVYNQTARTLDIYVNGVLDNGVLRGAIPAAQAVPNLNVNIGRRTGGYYFSGVIDEVHVYSRALSSAEIASDMATPLEGGAPPDTTAPTVSITSPAAGATVSGSIAITATATDNVAMGGVQFRLDGVNVGSEVTGAGPAYSFNWITTGATNGTHALSAVARDAANNTATSAGVSITVSNSDTTLPTISLTAPPAGSTLGGNVTITATATDNIGMAGVQFLLDGANLGAEVTDLGPTYTFNWSTSTATNASHILSARARDGAGNLATAANVSVTVANTPPSGLIAAYAMDQGSGTSLADSSGNAITGMITGATWTTAKYGNALFFNGSTNYVNLGNPTVLRGTGSMTWTAWVKATATPADDGQIIAKSDNNSGWQFKTSPDTGPHTFAISVSSGSGAFAQRYSTTVRQLNVWYHVAGVYNQTARTLDMYVNGVLDNGILRGTIPATQRVPNVNVNIGRRTGGFYFPGVIDEVRVFNRALSQAEIQALMNTPISPVSAVNIHAFKFVPNPDNMARGSLVSWTNLDGATHRIVSDTGLFDTQNITTGQSATVALPAAGAYGYHCSIHTSMVGTIVVQ